MSEPNYDYGFIHPQPDGTRPLRPDYDTFGANKRPGHGGLDLYPLIRNDDNPIVATAAGTVRFAGQGSVDAGWLVEILHPGDPGWYLTRSMHMLNQPAVATGDTVTAGNIVGIVGKTGNANSPHNHHEIRYTPDPNAHLWTMYGSGWGVRYDPALFGILQPLEEDSMTEGIQRALKAAGLYGGPIDGVWTSEVEAAFTRMARRAVRNEKSNHQHRHRQQVRRKTGPADWSD